MKRLCLVSIAAACVAVLAAATQADAQSFRVVGFGDSLTEAFPFDAAANGCGSSSLDGCGYVARLTGKYGCSGANCSFTNRGRSGEKTLAGLSRIDQVLREKDWAYVVLLEGTNDIASGLSPQTARFNVEQMAAKAESRGVGVVHVSPIWFNPSIAKASTASDNDKVRSLRQQLSSLASGAKRCFVDAWSVLCPEGGSQAGCFASNYWTPPAGVIDHVGHPNTRGYNALGNEFFKRMGSFGPPGAVEPLSPTGEACGERLTLTWNDETQARSGCGNWFQIQIDGAGGTRFDQWFQQGDTCRGKECSLTVSAGLREGNHSFRVRTRNTAGYGPWSADLDFVSIPSAPRQIRKLRAPAGEIFATGGAIEFLWKPDDTAVEYRLEVVSATGGLVVDELLTPDDHCSETECAFTPESALASGRYTWRVRAENVCGGTWSNPELFTLFDSAPAVAPATVSASTRTFDATPILRWRPVEGADEYEIQDPLGTSIVLSSADACVGDTCRYLAPALGPGFYNWRVRARNPLGTGVWSESVTFELRDCNCLEGKAAGGSLYLFAVPEEWNGDLVIWASATNPYGLREIDDLGPLAHLQFDEGYAIAATSFSVSGWPVFRSERDLPKIYSVFRRRVGEPGRVYLAGKSNGALAVVNALDQNKMGNVVGALALCGPLAGSRNWEAALDLRLAYDVICAGVPGAGIPGDAKGLPAGSELTPNDVRAAVNFCTGVDRNRPQRTNEEKRRLKDLLAVTDLTEGGLQTAMIQATFGLSDLVRDKRKLNGGLPVGNEFVDYGSTELNIGIQRVRADGGAERRMMELDFTGEVGEARVVTLHTSRDPYWFVENEREFEELVDVENRLLGLVEEDEPTHCGFSVAETYSAWKTLTVWAEGGRQPKPKNLQRRCRQVQSVAAGSCRFVNRPKVDLLDSRIRPRP